MLAEQPPPEIDWQAVGAAIAWILAGAGTVIAAAWKKLRPPASSTTPPPPPAATHESAGALIASAVTTLRDAEEAIRALKDTNVDSQLSFASQLGALRELVEDIQSSSRALRRLVAKAEGPKSGGA